LVFDRLRSFSSNFLSVYFETSRRNRPTNCSSPSHSRSMSSGSSFPFNAFLCPLSVRTFCLFPSSEKVFFPLLPAACQWLPLVSPFFLFRPLCNKCFLLLFFLFPPEEEYSQFFSLLLNAYPIFTQPRLFLSLKSSKYFSSRLALFLLLFLFASSLFLLLFLFDMRSSPLHSLLVYCKLLLKVIFSS